ncbi:MAG: oligoendopeptidase F, partial [Alphaproteobacteria bacterium]|nr:oligoendopeptidase F [Alphaproteobacteria bacterium]
MFTLPLCPPDIFRDKAEGGGGEFGDLPEWNLDDLYPSTDGVEITRDLGWLKEECAAFAATYEGKLAALNGADMLACIQAYEKIQSVAGRIMSFAGLRYYQNTVDADRAKFMSDMQGTITDMSTALVFFSLELNRIDDKVLAAMLDSNQALRRYKPVLDRMRAMKPYQLSDELEKFLHDQSVVGSTAWNRLFDESTAALTFDVDGEALNLESTLNLLTDQNREKREKGARAVASVFGENLPLYARIT